MRARYVEYKAGKVSEEDMCGEMVTMHEGMTEAVMMKAATDFMDALFSRTIFSRDAGTGQAACTRTAAKSGRCLRRTSG